MTDQERTEIIFAPAEAIAAQDADAHYAKLFDVFIATIPDYMHRVGDDAPSPKRPLGFSADADRFQFWLRLDKNYAGTAAVFDYKKKKQIWILHHFISQIGSGPFTFSTTYSKTLANAILTAKEMYQEFKASNAELLIGSGASPEEAVQDALAKKKDGKLVIN